MYIYISLSHTRVCKDGQRHTRTHTYVHTVEKKKKKREKGMGGSLSDCEKGVPADLTSMVTD